MYNNEDAPPVVVEFAGSQAIVKRRPWWIYTLIGFGSVILLALLLSAGIGLYLLSLVKNYTAAKPLVIEKTVFSQVKLDDLAIRWTQFQSAMEKGKRPPPFRISPEDLNQILAKNKNMNGRLRFQMTNDQLSAVFSFPMGKQGLKGRYLNGIANFAVGLEDGFLAMKIASAQVNGRQFPGWMMGKIKAQNLVDKLNDAPGILDVLMVLDDVTIKSNQITFVPVGVSP